MRKLKIIAAGSCGMWLFSVVMIFIFPRVRYPALSTVFAVLFWLSLIVSCFFSYLLISSIQERKKRQRKKHSPSSVLPPGAISRQSASEIKVDRPQNKIK